MKFNKEFLKKYKSKLLIMAVVIVILAVAFMSGEEADKKVLPEKEFTSGNLQADSSTSEEKYSNDTTEFISETNISIIETTDNTLKCTIAISCGTILNHMDKLNTDKKDCVPSDGWILKETTVEFKEGETVFDILKKVTKDNKIHMEFSGSGKAGTAYIEGINNIYEFDCGSISGWMYAVNDEYFSSGCSNYKVSLGDKIKWLYSCDLGNDVGNIYSPN